MNSAKNEARVIAYFPETQKYAKTGPMLRIQGYGEGSSLSVAVYRAFKEVMKDPQMRHKSPNYIYLSVGAYGLEPLDFF